MGYIEVRVGQVPGEIQNFALNGDRTVGAALAAAKLVADGFDIRVNGTPATLDTTIGNGATVILAKQTKGN